MFNRTGRVIGPVFLGGASSGYSLDLSSELLSGVNVRIPSMGAQRGTHACRATNFAELPTSMHNGVSSVREVATGWNFRIP